MHEYSVWCADKTKNKTKMCDIWGRDATFYTKVDTELGLSLLDKRGLHCIEKRFIRVQSAYSY